MLLQIMLQLSCVSIVHSGMSAMTENNIENIGETEVERAENGSDRGETSERREILFGSKKKNCLRNAELLL